MRIVLIAIGEKPPPWVRDGFADYVRRIPRPWTPELLELPLGQRGKSSDPERAIADEGARVLAALPKAAHVVVLDERGSAWTSVQLSQRMAAWAGLGSPVALLIGGPDGHAPAVLQRAQERWSLSALTLPHALARVVLAEQLYRGWSLLQGHPYHRA